MKFAAALCAAVLLALQPASQSRVIIAAGTLIDGTGTLTRNTRIVVQGSRIAAIDPAAAPVDIDLSRQTVMPGWIDTHVHLSWHFDGHGRLASRKEPVEETARYALENARATLLAGFTTVRSLGDPVDLAVRAAFAQRPTEGPRVLTSVRQILGGKPDALRVLVRELAGAGADAVKLFATEGLGGSRRQLMSDAQLRAACDEARAVGLPSAVHAIYDDGARAAVRAGCTSIEHGTFLSDTTLKLMAERGTWFDPNLLVWHNYLERPQAFGLRRDSLAEIRRAGRPSAEVITRARKRGVRIVFGTDAVAGAHGRNAEEFIYRVREAGEQPADVIASATSLAAESLGLSKRIGAIAEGLEADLVATDGNPLDDITAVRRVVFVMRSGTVVSRAGK